MSFVFFTKPPPSSHRPVEEVRNQGRNMVYGLKAQNMTGIEAQRKGLRAQKKGIREYKVLEPESWIRFIIRSKNLLSQYFSA